MHSHRTLTGTPQNLLNPSHRTLHFEDEPAVVTVLTHIRALWTTVPPSPTALETVKTQDFDLPGPWSIARDYTLNPQQDGYEGLEWTNDDGGSTPFREQVGGMFAPVFVDVMACLPGLQCSAGHMHGPGHEIFAVPFPKSMGTGGVSDMETMRMTWNSNVVMIPAYVAEGCKIRMEVSSDEGSSALGAFAHKEPGYEVWYVRTGEEVIFHVESPGKAATPGKPASEEPAAVLAAARLCTDLHGYENHCLFARFPGIGMFASRMAGSPMAAHGEVRQGITCGPGGMRTDEEGNQWWECSAECGSISMAADAMAKDEEEKEAEAEGKQPPAA